MSVFRAQLIPLSCIVALVSAGCSFSALKEDLERIEELAHSFTGMVSTEGLESESIILVAFYDPQGKDIAGFQTKYGPGPFEALLDPVPAYFFGFNDLNKDLIFQRDEPYGWAADGQAVGASGKSTENVDITISVDVSNQPPLPEQLVDEPLEEHFDAHLSFSIGTVSSLDNPWFSEEHAKKGLWEPYAFMEDGGTGIHFLEPYDPDRTPVLFVHGINGSPRNFAALIEQLDHSRYQAWVFSYPSGLKLAWLAKGLGGFLEVLHSTLQFDELHVVAHSMGGLVSRGTFNQCMMASDCSYFRTYTSISTPWNGVASAQSGVKWAPAVVPVWRDLDPTSEYVTTLFDTPLPDHVPYHLLFGFRQDSIFGSESSDGVIALTSQLRHSAQDQAVLVHGYDEDHVSILSNEMVLQQVYAILDSASEAEK